MRVEVKIEDPGDTEEVEVVEISVEPGASVEEGRCRCSRSPPTRRTWTSRRRRTASSQEILVAEGDIVPVDQVFVILEAS